MTVTYRLDFKTRWWAAWEIPGAHTTTILWSVILIVFVASFHFVSGTGANERIQIVPLLIVAAAVSAVGALLAPLLTLVRAVQLPGSSGPVSVFFSEEGYSTTCEGTSTMIPWSSIRMVQVKRHNLFLMRGPQWGFVPRRAFESPDAFAEAADFARSRAGGVAKVSPSASAQPRSPRPRASQANPLQFEPKVLEAVPINPQPKASPYAPPRSVPHAAQAVPNGRPPRQEDVIARVSVPPEFMTQLRKPSSYLRSYPQLLLVPGVLVFRVLSDQSPRGAALFTVVVVVAIGLFIAAQYLPWTTRFAMLARTPVVLDFTEEAVRFWSPRERGALGWAKFTRITETQVAFVFKVAEQTPFFAPKDLFEHPAEVRAVRQLIRRYAGDRSRLLER